MLNSTQCPRNFNQVSSNDHVGTVGSWEIQLVAPNRSPLLRKRIAIPIAPNRSLRTTRNNKSWETKGENVAKHLDIDVYGSD